MRLHLNFDHELLARYAARRAPAPVGIWFEREQRAYPGVGWSDFGLVILGWWIVAVERFARDEGDGVLLFMEGARSMALVRDRGELVVRLEGEDVAWPVSLRELGEELLGAAALMAEQLARFEPWAAELHALERAARTLRERIT